MRYAARTTLVIVVAFTIPFALFLWWTEADLRPRLEGLAMADLESQARLVRTATEEAAFSDSLADALGEAAGIRVTLIDRSGRVLGDSEVSAGRLPDIENHADRPEVAAALDGRLGSDIRASETVSLRLLYVAVADPRGALRVSVPLSRIDFVVIRSRQWVLVGGLLTLLAGLLLGQRVDRFRLRPVARLRDTLAAIGRGESGSRVAFEGSGLLASVGRSVDEMADRVEERTAALAHEATDLRSVFDELEDGVAQVSREGIILGANRAFEKWIGRSGSTGERIRSLLRNPDNVAAVESAIAGHAASTETDIGGHTVRFAARPYAEGALIILRDLTRTRQLESVRQDFVANVSHELKTPLTNVRGFAEAIAGDAGVPAGPRGFAERIVANSGRMQTLVDDLLDLSRIESGAWMPDPALLDLATVTREVWNTFDRRPEEADVSLELDSPPDFVIRVDPGGWRQILRNLLDNALRYAPSGSTVRLSARREADRDRIEVTDEGSGIPEAHQLRVFERFYRVDAARSREAGGTGLGLSIVKHLTAVHGGEVGIESEVGRGTTVWVELPAASPPADQGAT